ncbi:hypothetical protein MRX96_035093 [Rhipicephalus microplus]
MLRVALTALVDERLFLPRKDVYSLKQMAMPSRSEQKKKQQWSFSRFITPSAAKIVLSRAQISARAPSTKQVPCRSQSSTTHGKSTRYDNIRHEKWLFWL